jgi:hypothetical protein
MLSAESHLHLGDSTTALARIEEFVRRWPVGPPDYGGSLWPQSPSWGRAWLLFADLSLAAGRRDQARRGYRMVVGLWSGGDPAVQPMVERARSALLRLGN